MKNFINFKLLSLIAGILFTAGSVLAQCQANFTHSVGANGTVTFTNNSTSQGGNISHANWDFGDGSYGYNYNETHTYTTNGVYYVCLIAIDSLNNCTSTFCDSVLITNASGGNGGGNTTNCNFNFGAYPDSINNDVYFWQQSNGSNFTWDFGDGTTGSGPFPVHTYNQPGTYYYCLTVDTCPIVCDSVVVGPTSGGSGGNNLPCQAAYYWYPDSAGQYGIVMVNTSTGSGLTYMWDFGDNSISNLAYPTHTYNQPGTYVVCLTVTGNNCTSTFCDTITVTQKTGNLTINVISPIQTSVESLPSNISNVSTYPNPFSNQLNIEISLREYTAVEVYVTNILGEQIATITNGSLNAGLNKLIWNSNGLTKGVYLLNIKTDKALSVQKIILK